MIKNVPFAMMFLLFALTSTSIGHIISFKKDIYPPSSKGQVFVMRVPCVNMHHQLQKWVPWRTVSPNSSLMQKMTVNHKILSCSSFSPPEYGNSSSLPLIGH